MTSMKSGGQAAYEVRNVVVVGPGGSGKTTVIETLLNTVGATTRVGRVEDGTTVMDFEDVEKRLQYSINLAVASVDVTDPALVGEHGTVRLNLLDSPGNPDFVGELRAGLRGCDAALFVISATDGIDGATRRVWNEAADVGTPRAIVVTDVDEENTDFEATMEDLKASFGSGVHALYLPYEAKDPKTAAIISVVRGKVMRGFGPNAFDEWRYLDVGQPGQDCSGRPLNPDFVLNQPRYQGAQILLTRDNFGCGSSREHAPWALEDYGFRVLIGPSFADIFYNNSFKNGLLPIRLTAVEVDELFAQCEANEGYRLVVDLAAQTITRLDGKTLHFEVDPFRKECLLNGWDDIGLTLRHADEIRAFEAKRRAEHPYYFA